MLHDFLHHARLMPRPLWQGSGSFLVVRGEIIVQNRFLALQKKIRRELYNLFNTSEEKKSEMRCFAALSTVLWLPDLAGFTTGRSTLPSSMHSYKNRKYNVTTIFTLSHLADLKIETLSIC